MNNERHACQNGNWGGFIRNNDGTFTCRDCGRAVVEALTIKSINDMTMWMAPFGFSTANGADLDRIGKDLGVSREDPWVKVGTTTIDGTIMQVASSLLLGRALATLEDADRTIDIMVRDTHPWFVGGRHLMAKGSHVNLHTGTALIRCDIVRRQSEIDAERDAEVEAGLASVAAQRVLVGPCDANGRCPECGPHGNDGRVLGFEEWYPCTMCGDAVAPDPAVVDEALAEAHQHAAELNANPEFSQRFIATVVRTGQVVMADGSVATVKDGQLVDGAPSGFSVPGKAEVDNYLRHCELRMRFNGGRM